MTAAAARSGGRTERFGNVWRAVPRLVALAAMTAVLLPAQLLALAARHRAAGRIPVLYYKGARRILGIDIEVHGRQTPHRPALFIANHASYLDIIVMGSAVEGSFVSKAEVRDWPVIGFLCVLCRTVFVDRRRRTAHHQRDTLNERLAAGDRLILFPEGTSSDGQRVLPFKSTLLSVAEIHPGGEPLWVQPVTVAYTHLDGLPLGRGLRPLIAWYGGMDFGRHFLGVAGMGRVGARLIFHSPVTVDALGDRKALARHCETAIGRGLVHALSGRDMDALEPLVAGAVVPAQPASGPSS